MTKRVPTFIDLFSGIGGTRLGFESSGFRCVYSSEIDEFARKTYTANFGSDHLYGDIRSDMAFVPRHDVLVGGFPCQPFSLAGVSRRNHLNQKHGFDDKISGTLFFEVAKILDKYKPQSFLLENVKNLVSHNRGITFRTILSVLEDDLGYQVSYRVIDASKYLPQHRQRIYIVGFRSTTRFSFDNIWVPSKPKSLKSVILSNEMVDDKYTLSFKLWKYLQDYSEKHRRAGNGFGFGLIDRNESTRTRTLSARYHKDGSEILVSRGVGRNPRRLTPRECAKLMGFPASFQIPVSDTQSYKQFGNSVAVPVVAAIAAEMKKYIK